MILGDVFTRYAVSGIVRRLMCVFKGKGAATGYSMFCMKIAPCANEQKGHVPYRQMHKTR